MKSLRVLQDEVEARSAEIAASGAEWPCRRGCDLCCRRLKSVPRLTAPELDLLREGLEKLAPAVRTEVEERIRELDAAPPVVCPFLDRDEGACLVYDHRPIARRTYGFYVERDGGLYCPDILDRIERGECDGVVWGNGEAVERKLDELGPRYDLREPATRAARKNSHENHRGCHYRSLTVAAHYGVKEPRP